MKLQIAILLLGLAAFTSANTLRKLQQLPIKAIVKTAPIVDLEEVEVEEPVVVVKSPVRVVDRAPIQIVNREREVEVVPVRSHTLVRENEKIAEEQARSAHYQFASAVDDGIMDHSHVRQETRDGLKVSGTYAYSDGYFKRTVNYEADENGYRVVGETVEPISESGPVIDLEHGHAEIHTQISGVDTQYRVHADEIALLKKDTKVLI